MAKQIDYLDANSKKVALNRMRACIAAMDKEGFGYGNVSSDTPRTRAIRCALLHKWCRDKTNKICLCPLFTGGPKCSWAKVMTQSEEKDQIHRLRAYLHREGIDHGSYAKQLLN